MKYVKTIIIVAVVAVILFLGVLIFGADDEDQYEQDNNPVSSEQAEGTKTSEDKEKTADTATSKKDDDAGTEKNLQSVPDENLSPARDDIDDPDGYSEDDAEYDDEDYVDDEGSEDSYVFETTGNFTDINPEVFEHAYISAKTLVGRWYEDGFTNGYYIEFYGDGTWRYYGEKNIGGTYELYNNSNTLQYSSTEDSIASFFIYDDDGDKMSMGVYDVQNFVTRTLSDPVYFRHEEQSSYCENLEAFYVERYPYSYLEGTWYPVGDDAGLIYYTISVDGIYSLWEVYEGEAGGVDAGQLKKTGDGTFDSINGRVTVVESDEGYLYINGELYERR